MAAPLAEQLRPKTLDDFLGQDHLVGQHAILRKVIESGNLPSMIFWGPPGVGKTTLAYIIAKQLNKPFFILSAINSGVKDIRNIIDQATESGKGAILFIDEIHRFSKSQQDSLLGAVEKGIITLIGATTENPSFEVISPLLSRCQVYTMKPLSEKELTLLLNRALKKDIYLAKYEIEIRENEALIRVSGGDARKLYNALELVVSSEASETGSEKISIDNEKVLKHVQKNLALYDKNGEQHYDIISAFIKSLRGSDPNAAVYWLARMVEGGEDPKFIARRMVVFASEDIGLADPRALTLALEAWQIYERMGSPEGELAIAQAVMYMACAPKSNAGYVAFGEAMSDAKQHGSLDVPMHLRNAPTRLTKELGYSKNYRYAHNEEEAYAAGEQYFPEGMPQDRHYYHPTARGLEIKIAEKLAHLRKLDEQKKTT